MLTYVCENKMYHNYKNNGGEIKMKSVNKNDKLWTSITVELLEKREEYTSLTPACCFQLGSCCLEVCANCCWNVKF